MKYKAVLWDTDGVILGSHRFSFEFLQKICEDYKMENPFKTFDDWRKNVDENWRKSYHKLGFKSEQVEEIHQLFHEFYANEKIPLNKGIKNIVSILNQRRTKQGIVTSNHKELITKHLDRLGLLNNFEFIIESNSENGGKKAGLLSALERTKTSQKDAVYIGDMVGDMAAAYSAGIKFIAHTNGFHTKERLRKVGEKYKNTIFVNSTRKLKRYLL